MNLCIIGPSGCGKGTQAKKIAEKYHLLHISTGALFREILALGKSGEIVKKIRYYTETGQWVPSDLVFKILEKKLTSNFILDGTPRYVKQCPMLAKLLAKRGESLTACIYMNLSRKEWEKRRKLYGETFQDKTRNDNSPEIQEKRWRSGERTLGKIVKYYQARGNLIEVNADRPIEPIFADICSHLDRLK